ALAELAPLQHVTARRLPAGAGTAQRAGADIEAAAIEPHHRDRKAVALGAEAVGDRDPAILENDHRGRLGVPAELFFLLAEREALRALFDHEARNAFRAALAGAHHRDVDVAGAAARDEGLRAVQHIMI